MKVYEGVHSSSLELVRDKKDRVVKSGFDGVDLVSINWEKENQRAIADIQRSIVKREHEASHD